MSNYIRKQTPGNTDWFVHDRFGMFIHFGLYALPARHEWIKNRESISEEKYQKYFDHFNPDLLDAREWAKMAKAAGMKYAVLTTKHHEGFCLFDSQFTDYKSTNTAYGKDIVIEFVDAFRAEGLKIGFYYSLLDWHHPHYPIDRNHPRRNDANAAELDSGRNIKIYNEYMRNQVTELLSNYGKIDILWFDFSSTPIKDAPDWMQFGGGKSKNEWEGEELIALCRRLMPEIIINDRIGIPQDLTTPEQTMPDHWIRDKETGEYLTWEACQTFSGSWGYHREESSWKTPQMLINTLVSSVALGGNLIMNVGPTGRGTFDNRAQNALKVYSDWLRVNGRSIYGCTMADECFKVPEGVKLTQSEDGKRLYIHLSDFAFNRLVVEGLDYNHIDYMQLLSDGSEVDYAYREAGHDAAGNPLPPYVRISISGRIFTEPNSVIEVFLK